MLVLKAAVETLVDTGYQPEMASFRTTAAATPARSSKEKRRRVVRSNKCQQRKF
jgi:hypothetical protein